MTSSTSEISTFDAFVLHVKREAPPQFLQYLVRTCAKGRKRKKCAVATLVGCTSRRLDELVEKVKAALAKASVDTLETRYASFLQKIPDVNSDLWPAFAREHLADIRKELENNRVENKRKREEERSRHESEEQLNDAAVEAALIELDVLASVKRSCDEAPLAARIAKCKGLAEEMRQLLLPLPAEIKKEIMSTLAAEFFVVEKAVAFPKPSHEQKPACPSDELPRTNGSAQEKDDTDSIDLGFEPERVPDPDSMPADAGEGDREPSDELPRTNGSALEEDDTDRVSDCAPLSPLSELSAHPEEPWPPIGLPERTLPQLPAGPSDALVCTNGSDQKECGSDGVSHSPDGLSAKSKETTLGAKSQEECGTDGPLASAEDPDDLIDSLFNRDLCLCSER